MDSETFGGDGYRAAVGATLRAPLLSRQLAYDGYGLNHPIPAEVVNGGGGADPIVVDAGPGVYCSW